VILIRKDLVADILRENGSSQTELAKELNFSEKHLSEIINGKSGQSLKNFERIAKAIGIPFSELIYETDEQGSDDEPNKSIMPNDKSLASYDLEQITKAISKHHPDFGFLLRLANKKMPNMDESDKKFLAASIILALGRVVREEVKTESRDGRL
jgi:transcriptional regulator with XRE-family HTH domain